MTVDALNCQRTIAQQIVDQGGDYALALKGSQGMLQDDVVQLLDDSASKVSTAKPDVDAGHGRIETRTATGSTDIERLQNAHHLAVLRQMALNAMQKEGANGSLRGKFKRAGWNETYLTHLLAVF